MMRSLNTTNTTQPKHPDESTRPNNPKAVRSFSSPSSSQTLGSDTNAKLANLRPPTIYTTPPASNPAQLPLPRARPPLRLRNQSQQNAPSLKPRQTTTTITTTTTRTRPGIRTVSAPTMPPGSDNSNRPRHPHLSATAAKALTRPPLTPKIAAKTSPHLGSTPLSRRSLNAGSTAPSISNTHNEDVSSSPGLASHLPAITPRIANRQSTYSTSTHTPILRKESDISDGNSSRQSSQQDSRDSKFFFASEVKTGGQQPPPPQPQVQQRPVTFYYANGSQAESRKSSSPSSTSSFNPAQASTPEPTSRKFFHANGAPDHLHAAQAPLHSPRATPSRPGTASSSVSQGPTPSQRPMSPAKAATTPTSAPLHQANPTPTNVTNRPISSSPSSLLPAHNPQGGRRVSIESPKRPQRGHARTGSVPVFDFLAAQKYAQSPTSAPSSPPQSPACQPAMTMASILQAVEDMKSDSGRDDDSLGELQSPTKSSHGDMVSDLVANARRERKVQDLEITNASLEAINRTLERQLRRQTAELRRIRRMSRAGKMMSAASSRVPSAALPEVPVDFSDPSGEESQAEEEPESIHESEFSSDEGSADEALSPNAKMASRRKQEEIRLKLDLTKHQELLVDSQKINQSIKRCLDWTEGLIKEGQKALEYKVRVSDIKFGGHVLAPPDDDEEERGSAIQEFDADEQLSLENLEPWSAASSKDRDSGIELPSDKGLS
ncbi:hypothetical protein V2G26_006070 [Clonostachys chloroleuca]